MRIMIVVLYLISSEEPHVSLSLFTMEVVVEVFMQAVSQVLVTVILVTLYWSRGDRTEVSNSFSKD